MAVDDAIAAGARALFGEKYGDEVRVVSMGQYEGGPSAGKTFSIELCGGTHVARTGDIGLVAVVDEGAVSAGVRRIEALTGAAARRHFNAESARLRAVAAALRAPPAEAPERIAALMEDRKRLERELAEAKKKLAMGGGEAQAAAARDIGGTALVARVLDGVDAKELKGIVDEAKASLGSGVVAVIGRAADGKASVVVGVTADKTASVSAVDLVRAASAALGGKGGGGRPDFAQAGGPDGGNAEQAIAAIEAVLAAAGAG